ncbi:MAG TPA: DUF4908 domain-containing protein [Caulobacteraceae bacterium]|nr:DUF4908 domain-containing protein [Caulobacteraceae bacterium]
MAASLAVLAAPALARGPARIASERSAATGRPSAWARATAGDSGWMRARLTEPSPPDGAGAVARYRTDDGAVFILDRSSRQPLLKFEDSSEVWVLWPERGPRGDIIYRNDAGQPVLRATRLGGMTVFTDRRPGGAAASFDGGATPLRLTPLGPVALYQRLFQASVRCTRAAGRLIGFDAPDASPASDPLIADAALTAAAALANLSARPGGKARLASISKVAFLEGARTGVSYKSGVVTITVAPSWGVAGRPSSEKILQALGVR